MHRKEPSPQEKTTENNSDISLLYVQAIQSSPDFIAIVDNNYVYRFVNDSYLRRHSKTKNEVVNHHVSDILGKDVFEEGIKPHFDQCLSGEEVRYQGWFSYPGLGKRFMDVSYHPVKATGSSVEYVTATIRDITDLKQMESELQRQKEHLTSILETSLDGIAVTSEDQKVVYGNRALAVMFGYDDIDDLIGTPTNSYFAPSSYSVLSQIRKKLDQGKPINDIIEFVGLRQDGSTFDAELRLGSFFQGGQRLDAAAIRDVSDHKKMEFQLNQSSKLAAIGELATGVAHEINNPIAAIDVHVGLIHDVFEDVKDEIDEACSKQVNRYFEEIDKLVDRCRSATNSLLSFSRTSHGEARVYTINELVRETVGLVSSLSLADTDFEANFDYELPECWGNPNLLRQVIVSLLTNAVKATKSKGKVIITTGLTDDGNIRIEIQDSGDGIPNAIKDRIFDPFFTTSPEGEGTGLGLSISYYMIKQMNGEISVESTPGQGTIFTVTLPVVVNPTKPE